MANDGAEQGREPCARDIDVIYRETNRLYYEIARGCGISETAMWMLYFILVNGGRAGQSFLVSACSYSRSTSSSALKSLEAKGLIRLIFAEGSRKSKEAVLTDEGRAFCEEYIQPAVDAEACAFQTLDAAERREFVRLVRKFADAVGSEFAHIHELAQSRKEK